MFTATKKALEETKQATGENPENMGVGDDEGARGGEDAEMPQEEGE